MAQTCFVVEERQGRPVLAMWALPSLQEVATLELPAVPLDLDGRFPDGLLLAVDRDHATLSSSDYASKLATVARWSFDEIAGPAAEPGDDADIAFGFTHRLWGTSRQLAWRSGRISITSERGHTSWRVDPARVEAAIQALFAERFWDLRSSVAAVPDESWIELSVRGPEGTKKGGLLANAWRRGPGMSCYGILEALFAEP